MDTNTSLESYPSRGEVDCWLDSIWDLADATECPAELLTDQGFTHNLAVRHTPGFQYIRFSPAGMSVFFGYWQPALSCPAPLLVHVPGYGAEMDAHSGLVAAGFNVLHISPLGYSTPKGADEAKRRDGSWPVLPDTVLSRGKKGYREWLAHCATAVGWASRQAEKIDNRISFFGSSQEGGGALLLASRFRGRGVRCVAADVPFLTDFPGAQDQGAYWLFSNTLRFVDNKESAWHVHRLDLPVLLTAGGIDEMCPPHTILAPSARLFSIPVFHVKWTESVKTIHPFHICRHATRQNT